MPQRQRRSTRAPQRSASRAAKSASNSLRIIAGQWRGRKLRFADLPGLRPTPDRVRETLFNWLQQDIVGARCLDLFSGSGALALEALSRGAAEATLVDSARPVIDQLATNLALLNAGNARVVHASAAVWLQQPGSPHDSGNYDLVFLDPPFRQGLLAECCRLLEQSGRLAARAWIYIEVEKELNPLPIPAGWQVLKHKDSGQVSSYLCRRDGERADIH